MSPLHLLIICFVLAIYIEINRHYFQTWFYDIYWSELCYINSVESLHYTSSNGNEKYLISSNILMHFVVRKTVKLWYCSHIYSRHGKGMEERGKNNLAFQIMSYKSFYNMFIYKLIILLVPKAKFQYILHESQILRSIAVINELYALKEDIKMRQTFASNFYRSKMLSNANAKISSYWTSS